MGFVTVDQELCSKDGHCIEECPARIIEFLPEFPTIEQDNQEFCIECGHCVAVCPKGAIALETLKPDACLSVDKKLSLSEDHVEHFLRSRRSIRTYKEKTVESTKIKKVLEVASYAPTASNRQPVQWLVIQDREKINRVIKYVIDWMKYVIEADPELAKDRNFDKIVANQGVEYDHICRGAPHLVYVYADKTILSAQSDCAIALTYLELVLPSFGLGGCWGGYVTYAAQFWPPLKNYLGLADTHDVFGAMMFGYPKYRYHRMPTRNPADISWL